MFHAHIGPYLCRTSLLFLLYQEVLIYTGSVIRQEWTSLTTFVSEADCHPEKGLTLPFTLQKSAIATMSRRVEAVTRV